MELLLLNTPQGLKPVYDEDYDKKKTLKIGETYKAKITMQRNPRFLGKFMSFIRASFACIPPHIQSELFHYDPELWRKQLEILVGSSEIVWNIKTETWQEQAKSISFGKMDEYEFQQLYDKVKNAAWEVLQRWGVSYKTLENAILSYDF